jgi:hypothetical protein
MEKRKGEERGKGRREERGGRGRREERGGKGRKEERGNRNILERIAWSQYSMRRLGRD